MHELTARSVRSIDGLTEPAPAADERHGDEEVDEQARHHAAVAAGARGYLDGAPLAS
jgi:hypothetical protein